MKYIQKLVNDLKENKAEAMFILSKHTSEKYLQEAKEYANEKGYLESNSIYIKQLFKNTFIIIDFINEAWESYRITYDNENNIKSEKDITKDLDLISVIDRTERYIYNYMNFINKAS